MKKTTTKSIISFLIVLAMFVTMTASTAFAATSSSTPYTHPNTYKNTGNQRVDIIGVAKTQLGYTEGGNGKTRYANNTKYGVWYGENKNYQPWCAMFVSWCANQAGIPTSILKKSACAGVSSNCFNIPYYYGKNFYPKSDKSHDGTNYTPKSGDLFFTKEWKHVGLVYYVDGNNFYTIEGNADPEGKGNDYYVCTRKRAISDCCFGVPNYSNNQSTNTQTQRTTISFNSVSGPGNVVKGNRASIYGTITSSNSNISTVQAVVYRCSDGKKMFDKSVNNINSKSYKLQLSKLDYALPFGTLDVGNYIITFFAKCADGTQASSKSFNFSILSPYTSVNFYLTAANYCYGYPCVNASSNFGRIFPGDRVQVTKVYSNGWAEGRCPWGGPIKTIYFKVNELKFKCTKYINAYSNANATTSAGGRAFPGDVCTLKSINSKTLLCNCPWGRGYKDIYLKLSDMT